MSDAPGRTERQNLGTELFGRHDDRTIVAPGVDTAICLIESYAHGTSRPSGIGTGWLASPSCVVTAAHVIVDSPTSGERTPHPNIDSRSIVERVRLVFLQTRSSPQVREASASQMIVHEAYAAHQANDAVEDRDVALIRFDEPLTPPIKPLSFGMQSDSALDNATVRIAGMKLDPSHDHPITVEHRGPVVEIGPRYLLCRVLTDKAQSGAPVSLIRDGEMPLVVAMHASGLRGTADSSTAGNFAVRIDEEMERWIRHMSA